jgi:dTDP-glucose pyrophosphorylase
MKVIRYPIDEYEGRAVYGNRLNIVMPMAGNGKRLAHLGHKPLVDVAGKPMVQWAVESLGIDGRYIFIVDADHVEDATPLLKSIKPDCVVVAEKVKRGAATGVLCAKPYIDNDSPLVTVNCDQYLEWEPAEFIRKARHNGLILTYTMTEADGSFCVMAGDKVIRVAEKDVVSDIGTVGVYYFGRGSDFVRAAEQMVAKDIRVNGEFYILPVYNELIEMGILPSIYHLDNDKRHVWRIGVERELVEFLDYMEYKNHEP